MLSHVMQPIGNYPAPAIDLTACILTLDNLKRTLDFVEQQISASQAEIATIRNMAENFIREQSLTSGSLSKEGKIDGVDDALLSLADLVQRLGVTRQTIWRLRKSGNFPEAVKYSQDARAIHFRRSDFENWLQDR